MKKGRQKPTYERIGDYAGSDGRAVAQMFEEDGGATFYPSQKYELTLMLARNGDGSPAAQTIGISKPRQNGKSYAARYYAIYMADFEHRSVLYSAHHSSTTKKMFDAMCDLVDSPERFPEFASDVKRITRGRGYEGIYFADWTDARGITHDGGCIEFATRTNAGARGGTYSVIVVDEAQEMTADQQEAMLPTISASADIRSRQKMPQQVYIGTPPGPACNGTVFRKMHDAAHGDGHTELWWLEWAVPDLKDVTPENALKLAYETNPAMGYRIAEKTILNEFEQMHADGFARERLGWWPPVASENIDYAIPAKVWDECMSEAPKPEGKTAYGVKFSSDGTTVALCGAVIPGEGKARISFIEQRNTGDGLAWLAEWLNMRAETACCVVIDGRNGVDVLTDRIRERWRFKDSVIKANAQTAIGAASLLINELNEKTVTWFRGQEALRASAVESVKRPISGGFGFGGENSAPIEAAALALWGARNSRRDPSRRMRVG